VVLHAPRRGGTEAVHKFTIRTRALPPFYLPPNPLHRHTIAGREPTSCFWGGLIGGYGFAHGNLAQKKANWAGVAAGTGVAFLAANVRGVSSEGV